MVETPAGETEARDALAVVFSHMLREASTAWDEFDQLADQLAVRLANAALANGWQPSRWTRAVGRLSVRLGESGAPWSDICPTDCQHDTCEAMRGIVPLLGTEWLPTHARQGEGGHRHYVSGAGPEYPHEHDRDGAAVGVPHAGQHIHPRRRPLATLTEEDRRG